MLKPRRDQVVAWRGPILDRALTQLLADVFWGDLDFLLLDLPPGTGDVAISLGQKLPNAEVLVVTTPQQAAAEVAERAGTMASMMNQRVIGVIENMAYLETTCPHCGETAPGRRLRHRRRRRGRAYAHRHGWAIDVPLLAQIPLDPAVRAGRRRRRTAGLLGPGPPCGCRAGRRRPDLAKRGRGLLGRQLGLAPDRPLRRLRVVRLPLGAGRPGRNMATPSATTANPIAHQNAMSKRCGNRGRCRRFDQRGLEDHRKDRRPECSADLLRQPGDDARVRHLRSFETHEGDRHHRNGDRAETDATHEQARPSATARWCSTRDNAKGTVAKPVITKPTSATHRAPTESVSRPASVRLSRVPTPWGISRRPAANASAPRTPWK